MTHIGRAACHCSHEFASSSGYSPSEAPVPSGDAEDTRTDHAADAVLPTRQQPADTGQIMFSPAQAAALLQVRESLLRRRAARRLVPCTFLGKHLRFSRDNLEQIAAAAVRPANAVASRSARPSRVCGSSSTRSRRRQGNSKFRSDEHI